MVEVFKTNVDDPHQANWIIEQIQNTFSGYTASFDLDDCDRVLVVKSKEGMIQGSHLIELLKRFDFRAEVLPDEII